MNSGVEKIRQEGGHIKVWVANTVLEYNTWDFVVGPKGLFFVCDYVDPFNIPVSVHSVEGKVIQQGPTKFRFESDSGIVAILETLSDGNNGNPDRIARALAAHAERVKSDTERDRRQRAESIEFGRELLGGELD